MGGGYYDRDVGSVTSSAGFDYSAYTNGAARAMSNSKIDSAVLPRGRTLRCAHRNPVVIAMDVTGSMGEWSKVIYDKMPMFFGQLKLQGYLTDPAVSFAAVGDAQTDKAPIQVCDFAQGDQLDDWLTRLWLEGNGGGQGRESYELTAYFYARYSEFVNPELPFFFFTGDEGFNIALDSGTLQKHLGVTAPVMQATAIFNELKRKYNVFLIQKDCSASYGADLDRKVKEQWRGVLGERVLHLDDPKAVIDVILGAIALVSGSRDLDTYLADMKGRDQTADRLAAVGKVLQPVSALARVDGTSRLPTLASGTDRSSQTRRF